MVYVVLKLCHTSARYQAQLFKGLPWARIAEDRNEVDPVFKRPVPHLNVTITIFPRRSSSVALSNTTYRGLVAAVSDHVCNLLFTLAVLKRVIASRRFLHQRDEHPFNPPVYR